jgi:transketolase
MAGKLLEEDGLSCRVLSVHTVKPLDQQALLAAARDARAVITVEEHSTQGGLGEACASLLMEKRVCVPFHIVGIPDEYTVTGSQEEILNHYGISGPGLAATARRMLNH